MVVRNYRFYGCYILESENPSAPKGKSYIGFTVDPIRRFRQHNGDLARGGAKRTKSLRPWRPICIVHGFRSQVQGLQFEWSWQHPLLSRSVRQEVMAAKIAGCKLTSRGRQRECRLESNLRILKAMLKSAPWDSMPLTVTFFDRALPQDFRQDIPPSLKTEFLPDVDTFDHNYVASDTGDDSDSPGLDRLSVCSACETAFSITGECRVVSCPDCGSYFHARCAATSFLSKEKKSSLLPAKEGECPVCSKKVLWSDFVRSAFVFKPRESSSSSSDSESEEEDGVVDLTSPERKDSPKILSAANGSSLRERLFKKTGGSSLFQI